MRWRTQEEVYPLKEQADVQVARTLVQLTACVNAKIRTFVAIQLPNNGEYVAAWRDREFSLRRAKESRQGGGKLADRILFS